MKTRVKLYLSLVFLMVSIKLSAQSSSSIGFGYDFINKKPTVDIQFNRESAQDADNKYDIFLSSKHYHLNPAAEAHFGSGAKTAADNIIVGLNSYLKYNGGKMGQNWTILNQFNILSPQFSSDKNFSVYQGFTSLGYKFITYYSKRDELGYIEFSLGADVETGLSKIDMIDGTKNISRFKATPAFIWNFYGKTSKPELSPLLDPDFYYRLQFSAGYTPVHFFKQDIRVIDKKDMGYFSTKLSYRFHKALQASISYKRGRVEPLYKDVDNVSLGLAIVAQ